MKTISRTLLLLAMAAFFFGVIVAWPRISFYRLTGRFSPIEKIETLQSPVAVTSWSSDGLHLVDGRTLQLPGLRSLPRESAGLREATKRGVEVQADGRVWGLVRIHHWCGNDPVREHIAKVDLAAMMIFLRLGEPAGPVPDARLLVEERGGSFTDCGWRIGEFLQFQSWQSLKDSAR
ncbi:MAG: hypothetical protein WCV00_21660 [Verrucomicrobiia bacterium]|jgi:hypothetical protein